MFWPNKMGKGEGSIKSSFDFIYNIKIVLQPFAPWRNSQILRHKISANLRLNSNNLIFSDCQPYRVLTCILSISKRKNGVNKNTIRKS